jgi:hypothetical protein
MDDCPKFKSLNDICNNPYEKKQLNNKHVQRALSHVLRFKCMETVNYSFLNYLFIYFFF